MIYALQTDFEIPLVLKFLVWIRRDCPAASTTQLCRV